MRIVLAGGSGQLGGVLARHLQELGHHVTVLTRSPYTAPWLTVHWDGQNTGPWMEFLEGAEVCINLAGRSLNCRWDAHNLREILASRLVTTRLLGRVMGELTRPPRVWINASTASVYRHSLDEEMDEESELGGNERMRRFPFGQRRAPASWNFWARAAQEIEAAFFRIETPRTRKIALRRGDVMSPEPGGAFGRLSNLTRMGLGGAEGNGRQYVAWIHERDFARAVEFLIARENLEGPINLTAPYPLTNRELMAGLREAWEVPNGLPAPAVAVWVAAWVVGANSESLLKSRCVIPGRLLDAGFAFEFPRWAEAAEDLVRIWRRQNG
jgi:hypothetical protein